MENDNKRMALEGIEKSNQLLNQHKANYEQAISGAEVEQEKATVCRNAAILLWGGGTVLLLFGTLNTLLLFVALALMFCGFRCMSASSKHNEVCDMFIHAANLAKNGINECSDLKDTFQNVLLLEENKKEST